MYIVSASINTGTKSTPLTANVANKGTDITKYLSDGGINKTTGAVTSAELSSDYVAFQNSEFVATNYQMNDSNEITSANSKDTYLFNTETNEIIRIASGTDLSDYIEEPKTATAPTAGTQVALSSGSLKSQYRLLAKSSISGGGTLTNTGEGLSAGITAVGANLTSDFASVQSENVLYDADGNAVSGIALSKYIDDNGNYTGGLFKNSQATDSVSSSDIGNYMAKNGADIAADLTFTLHVGADSIGTNKITTNIKSMSAASLGVDILKSSSVGIVDDSGAKATDAIDIISDALQKVSTQRSALGAVQNRLEHTIKNLDNVVENTTSAESQIRDTDMATEMVTYSNANILSQAGQAMLAQSNQSNQGVLSLLG
jgi:flagellin